MRKLLLALGVLSLVLPKAAEAHFNLLAPPSSNTGNNMEGGKGAPPCGPDTTPAATPTAVQGGSMFTLKINETVYHPGFYRIAIALKSRSELPADPTVWGDANKTMVLPITGPGNSVSADATGTAWPVLANNLFSTHTSTGAQQTEIRIPNVNCDDCTLQVIEFMAQHGPNPGGGYFYHHCADLKITADPTQPIEHGDGAGGTGGASASAGAGSAGSAGSSGAAIAGGGTGGVGTTNGGAPSASAGAAPASAGAPSSASAGASSAGAANATAGATSSAAGAPSASATDPGDNGGCSLSHRAVGSLPLVSLLLGWFALGLRRNRRG